MTKFLDPKFSVPVGGDAFRAGWERIFGNKKPEPPKPEPQKPEPKK